MWIIDWLKPNHSIEKRVDKMIKDHEKAYNAGLEGKSNPFFISNPKGFHDSNPVATQSYIKGREEYKRRNQ